MLLKLSEAFSGNVYAEKNSGYSAPACQALKLGHEQRAKHRGKRWYNREWNPQPRGFRIPFAGDVG